MRHLPGYIEHLNEIKGKGVDLIVVIAMNDAWVMSAWGKANGIRNDDIVSDRSAIAQFKTMDISLLISFSCLCQILVSIFQRA